MHPKALEDFKGMVMPILDAEAAAGSSDFLQAVFGRGAKLSNIKKLTGEQFLSRFMVFAVTQSGEQEIKFDKFQLVGVVSEGEYRHVLARVTAGAEGMSITEMQVLSLIPYEGQWKLELTGKIEGIANALKAALEVK